MVPLSMILSDFWPRFQGHDIFRHCVLCDELTSLIVTSGFEWCDGHNGVTGTSMMHDADAYRGSVYDQTAFDEQWNSAVPTEDIYGPTDFLCTR